MLIISNITGQSISLPEPKSVHSNGVDLVFVFKGFFPPFVLEEPYNYRVIFEKKERFYDGLQKKDEKELVEKEFSQRSRRKKSQLGR